MDLRTYLEAERGRRMKLAALLKVTPSLLTQWTRGKPVSVERCPAIEIATGYVVRRWDLRPADWHVIWPELRDAQGAPRIPEQEAA